MARDEINLHYLVYDVTDSVGTVNVEKQTVVQANGIKINNAFACKDNSMKIVVENTASADATVTIKAGSKQNAILGDAIVAVKGSASTVIAPLRDMARFENKDGSIELEFSSGFAGKIYAVGERAGLE